MQRKNKSSHSLQRIGIDLMGSDTQPDVLLKATIELALHYEKKVEFFLFLSKSVLPHKFPSVPVHFIPADDVIEMTDDPLLAIRRKKRASLCLGIRALKEEKIDAFISFGNTGALMASAKMTLKMLPGIQRPALLALLPAKHTEIAVLDVGANASFKPEHLVQFAQMGIAYQKSRGIPIPKVGLLNIGSEAGKGTPQMRAAYQNLEELNEGPEHPFIGNIEGRYALASPIDVLVTDGFTGNVFLKTAEGIAKVIREELQKSAFEISKSPAYNKALCALKSHLNYSEYPGALLCGVHGLVMKCHGEFSNLALKNTVEAAIGLINHSFLNQIKKQLV